MKEPDLSNTIPSWYTFGDDLWHRAIQMLDKPTIDLAGGGLTQPAIFAAALLSRTITNHKAMLLLAKAGLIVEARTLIRSCFENVLWLRRLAGEGAEFVKAILDDAEHQDISFAKTLLPAADFLSDDERRQLQQQASLNRPKKISPSDKAASREAINEYVLFKALSGDSAHPSAKSLSRHLPTDADGRIDDFFIEPPMSNQELAYTLHFGCLALLNAMLLYSAIAPSEAAAEIVMAVGGRFEVLADETLLQDV